MTTAKPSAPAPAMARFEAAPLAEPVLVEPPEADEPDPPLEEEREKVPMSWPADLQLAAKALTELSN